VAYFQRRIILDGAAETILNHLQVIGLSIQKELQASRVARSVIIEHQVLEDAHSNTFLCSELDGVFWPAVAEVDQEMGAAPLVTNRYGLVKCEFVTEPSVGNVQFLNQRKRLDARLVK